MNLRHLKAWLLPEVPEGLKQGMTGLNMQMIGKVSQGFLVLASILMVVYTALFAGSAAQHLLPLLGVFVVLLMFLFVALTVREWKRDPSAKTKKINYVFIELFYWLFSSWGVVVSWRMYLHDSQMMIMDTVQVGFMLIVCCYPLWGIARVLLMYLILFILLLNTDKAAQINYTIYWLMAVMVCFGTVLRYGTELRNLEQLRALKKQTKSLKKSSTHDEMTGLKNRAALREDFPNYCHKKLWVIMADVDHFKRYNDTYGHDVGDRILIKVANEILAHFGKKVSYRYGGDEFLIFQEGVSRNELTSLLASWSESIRNIHVDKIPEETFSCSYGYVSGTPVNVKELRNMVLLADQKLYDMKKAR